jgi:hypothetical protein
MVSPYIMTFLWYCTHLTPVLEAHSTTYAYTYAADVTCGLTCMVILDGDCVETYLCGTVILCGIPTSDSYVNPLLSWTSPVILLCGVDASLCWRSKTV